MRIARALVFAAVLALVATGCFRSDISVSVNDDGSGTITGVFAVNPKAYADFAKSFGSTGAAAADLGQDPCAQIQSDASQNGDLPTGSKVENYKDGDFCGIKFTTQFKSGDDISKSLAGTFGNLQSNGVGGFDSFTVTKDGNNWDFQAKPSASSGSTAGADVSVFKDLLKGASNVVRIKLPGRQVQTNADRIDGDGTMIWNLNVLGDPRTLSAHTEPGEPKRNQTLTDAGKTVAANVGGTSTGNGSTSGGGGGSSTAIIIVVVLVAVAAIGGFVLWRRSQSKATPALAGGGFPPPGAPFPTTPPAADPFAPAPAPAGPQWDASRNAYIQWDPARGRWMQYDDTAATWKPIE